MNSSPNPDPQLLLESGPMQIKDFNPKAILRFTGRKCLNCRGEILEHWLRSNGEGQYFCYEIADQVSEGLEPLDETQDALALEIANRWANGAPDELGIKPKR